ncbi:MAG: DsbA family protein [Hyphomicrobiaceae bacterium]|nr:DsbA family protein [Hyphomicrobiaceae bacterium]
MQFVVPALVGAVVSAAAFALFLTLSPATSPAPEQDVASKPETVGKPADGDAGLSEAQRADVEKTVRDYLLKNPQILVQMSAALEQHQAQEREKLIQTAISDNADMIFRDNYGLEAGDPEGDVTIVEFSDYNCPYCKRAFESLTKLLDSDKKVRVILKEFPIFGERSEGAARVAIAAKNQGKYFEVHTALLENRGQNNEQTALKLAERLGLDMEKLRADMNSDETKKIIRETRELGNKLGIQGTPFYLVGDRSIPGAPDNLLEVFQQNVADVRKNGCKANC